MKAPCSGPAASSQRELHGVWKRWRCLSCEELSAVFATATVEEWRERLAQLEGQWAPHQNLRMRQSDPQVLANGFLREVDAGDGSQFRVVANPVQFDETPPELVRGPETGQHTEEILLERGLAWERIAELKKSGAIN